MNTLTIEAKRSAVKAAHPDAQYRTDTDFDVLFSRLTPEEKALAVSCKYHHVEAGTSCNADHEHLHNLCCPERRDKISKSDAAEGTPAPAESGEKCPVSAHEWLEDALGRYQVTHIHNSIREAIKAMDKTEIATDSQPTAQLAEGERGICDLVSGPI